jgi:hypothetical protein
MSKFSDLYGKKVDITIGKKVYANRLLYFAGTNLVNQEVITTMCDRAIFFVDNWKYVKIVLSK